MATTIGRIAKNALTWDVWAALAILVFTGVAKWHSSQMPVNAKVPTPVMPSPNARDYYNHAAAMERDSVQVDWACERPMDSSGVPKSITNDPTKGYHVFTLAEKDKLVAENQPAIAELRRGMRFEYMAPPVRSFTGTFPEYAADRRMARLLMMQGQVQASHGQWSDSAQSYIDDVKLGTDIPRGGVLIAMLVGNACRQIGLKHFDETLTHLSAADAESAALRIARLDAATVPLTETLQQEEWATQGGLLEMFRDPNWRSKLVSDTDQGGDMGMVTVNRFKLQLESPRAAYSNFTSAMNAEIVKAARPWTGGGDAVAEATPDDPVCMLLMPVYSASKFTVARGTLMVRFAEVRLALQAYRMNRGSYPASLDSLVPSYLSAVPLDPFTAGNPLRYRKSGFSYLLYSVGPDGVDNGGAADLSAV